MEEFSYTDEFNRVAGVARISDDDDERISYSVFVGDPNSKGEDNFLGEEFFSVDDFTTYRDAQNALALVRRTLELVDKNLAMGLKLSDVRDEIIDAIAHKKNKGATTTLEVTRAINEIFDYYISHGA